VPTYNEAGNLPELLDSVFTRVPDIHVLVVDDSSPDGTGEIADSLAAGKYAGRLFVMHRAVKDGLGRAYVAGFGWALEKGYAAVVQMDADLSHDPLYLPSMIEAAGDAEVVIGSRYLNGISVINWPLRRILLSWGANKYVRFWTRVPVNDGTSGYRVYRRSVLEAIDLPTIKSNGYSFQVEMTFRSFVAGFKIVEVPIIFVERREGQSKMSKGVILESMQMPVRLRLRERALRKKLGGKAQPLEPAAK